MTSVGLKQARVLIFGQTGQVARALQSHAGAGWVFAGRDRADLSEPETIEQCIAAGEWDIIINAAAHTAVDQAESEPDLVMAINAAAPALMAKWTAAKNIPFIHISTDYVFDGSKKTPYVEEDVIRPANVYGRSKAEAEKQIMAAGGRPVILRTSWVYAPEGKNFIQTMIRLSEREELKIVNDQNGAPTAAADIADGIVKIAGRLFNDSSAKTGIFHMAGTGETSWYDFAREIFRLMDRQGLKTPARLIAIPSKEYPAPATRPLNSRMDCTKLEKAYGIRLPTWQDSLQACMTDIFSRQQPLKKVV